MSEHEREIAELIHDAERAEAGMEMAQMIGDHESATALREKAARLRGKAKELGYVS